eukprot:5597580-Amphidinium_carterae.1
MTQQGQGCLFCSMLVQGNIYPGVTYLLTSVWCLCAMPSSTAVAELLNSSSRSSRPTQQNL